MPALNSAFGCAACCGDQQQQCVRRTAGQVSGHTNTSHQQQNARLRGQCGTDSLPSKHEQTGYLLLGYMKKLGVQTLAAYKRQALLTPIPPPKFGGQGYFGRRVHEAVLAAGETQSGASIHVVDYDYDTGPILAQTTDARRYARDVREKSQSSRTSVAGKERWRTRHLTSQYL